MPVTQEDGDNYDYCDWPADRYPDDVLQTILRADRLQPLHETLWIFKPAAFGMLRRVQEDAKAPQYDYLEPRYRERVEAQCEHLESQYRAQLDFFREAAMCLADHVAAPVDLVHPTVKRLEAEEAFGLRADEGTSRWMEVGEEAHAPSLLYERTREDVCSIVAKTFAELPRAVQVALWFSTYVDGEYPAHQSPLSWDGPPSGTVDEWELRNMDEVFGKAAQKVMKLAGDDFWSFQEK